MKENKIFTGFCNPNPSLEHDIVKGIEVCNKTIPIYDSKKVYIGDLKNACDEFVEDSVFYFLNPSLNKFADGTFMKKFANRIDCSKEISGSYFSIYDNGSICSGNVFNLDKRFLFEKEIFINGSFLCCIPEISYKQSIELNLEKMEENGIFLSVEENTLKPNVDIVHKVVLKEIQRNNEKFDILIHSFYQDDILLVEIETSY